LDRDYAPISIPLTGVLLTGIPDSKKRQVAVERFPQQDTGASRLSKDANRRLNKNFAIILSFLE
jgi:hypothetical protein